MDEGESLHAAVVRELQEELGVRVVRCGPVAWSSTVERGAYELHFVQVQIEGSPVNLEHSALSWGRPSDLLAMDLAPGDRAFVEALQSGDAVLP